MKFDFPAFPDFPSQYTNMKYSDSLFAPPRPKQTILRRKYMINIEKCNDREKYEVSQLLDNYRRLIKSAPRDYVPDYYTLLARYPVTIEVRND